MDDNVPCRCRATAADHKAVPLVAKKKQKMYINTLKLFLDSI